MQAITRVLFTSLATAAMLLAPLLATAVETSLMIPAAAFSADGTNQIEYINYGDSIESDFNLHAHAGLKLPNAAVITNVNMMTRDEEAGTITMYLKRTKFGFDGGTETLLTFTSPGNIGCTAQGLCHDMESLLDIKVDTANYSYWFDLRVPDEDDGGANLRFYAVKVMYEYDDLIFADTFESTGTDMWSSDATLKLAHNRGDDTGVPPGELPKDEMLDQIASRLWIEDPVAHEALEAALKGEKGYGSPYVIPGPGFKTAGYIEYDDYYFSESYGFVYGRHTAEDGVVMRAPVNLPQGAEISFFIPFFVDSISDHSLLGYQDNIRFWLTRMDATDIIPTLNMAYITSSGAQDGIRTVTVTNAQMEAVETGCTTVNNAQYSYYATIDVGRYDISPPPPYDDEDWWHKVYAIVILYTMP